MIIAAYCQPVRVFKSEISDGSWITNLRNGYRELVGRRPASGEVDSWVNSLPHFCREVLDDEVFDDCIIMLEAKTAVNGSRIDVLLLGQNGNEELQLVVVELKGWKDVRASIESDQVQTYFRGTRGEFVDADHPAIQAGDYLQMIRFSERSCDCSLDEYQIQTHAYAYLLNMPAGPTCDPLFDEKFEEINDEVPMFLAGEGRILRATLQPIIGNGGGESVLPYIQDSGAYISRSLVTLAREHLQDEPLFNLIGKQARANREIQYMFENLDSDQKQVVIIEGGPGSGKTAVGIESMLTAVNSGMTRVGFVVRNAGLLQPLRKMLRRTGLTPFIRYPYVFVTQFTNNTGNTYGSEDDSFDFVVVDETHRIPEYNRRYLTWGIKEEYQSGLRTVEEIIRCSQVSVFIIDERQVVTPASTDMEMILESAENYGARVTRHVLPYQFRAGGSSQYLDWVKSMIYPDESRPHFNLQSGSRTEPMRFNIVDDPNVFHTMVEESPDNDIRMISGYCWYWNNPNRGVLPLDITIENHQSGAFPEVESFLATWEDKRTGRAATWAIRQDAMSEVGCIYTIQGLDFDRICLIWPLDLQWNSETETWSGFPGRTTHTAKQNNGPNMYDNWDKDLRMLDETSIVHFLQNVYYVLLTRANAEIFVYFMHDETRQYFETWH